LRVRSAIVDIAPSGQFDDRAVTPAGPTARKRERLAVIAQRINRMRVFLGAEPTPGLDAPPLAWLAFLAEMKRIVGNASNDLGFVTTLLAHRYLQRTLPMASIDAAAKAQGAPGLDIDARTRDGTRVVGEIKATVPYGGTSLGANQLNSWRTDFQKLAAADAGHRFFFVVDPEAFRLVREVYANLIPGVRVVLLTTGEEFACPDT